MQIYLSVQTWYLLHSFKWLSLLWKLLIYVHNTAIYRVNLQQLRLSQKPRVFVIW